MNKKLFEDWLTAQVKAGNFQIDRQSAEQAFSAGFQMGRAVALDEMTDDAE